MLFVTCFYIKNILTQTCQKETDYYTSIISELQKDREFLKQKLDGLSNEISSLKEENKKFTDKFTEYMNRLKKEEYVLFPTNWVNTSSSNPYSIVPGLLKTIRVLNKAKLKGTIHFHFYCSSNSRLDIGIFINGILTGIEHQVQETNPDLAFGTALTHLNNWVSSVTLASKTLEAGDYTIEVRSRVKFGSTCFFNGIVAFIEIFYD